jgi:hypothetical protein
MTLPRFVLWQARDAGEKRGNHCEDGRGAEGAMGAGEDREAMKAWRMSNNNKKPKPRA